MDTVSVFSLLEGVVFCLSVMAGIIWLRQRRMRGLYNACKVTIIVEIINVLDNQIMIDQSQNEYFQEGKLETVEQELAKGVGDEELGIALMWASSAGKVK